MARYRLATSGIVAMLLAGCASGPGPVTAMTPSPTSVLSSVPEDEAVTTPSPDETLPDKPPMPMPDPSGSATWSMQSTSGFSYELTISTFPPTIEGTNGDHLVGSGCGFDAQTDIAVPVLVTAVATTTGFDTPIEASFITKHQTDRAYTGTGVAPALHDDRLRVEQYFSDETVCRTWSSTDFWGYGGADLAAIRWQNPAPEGTKLEHRFTVIVTNYRTPNTPDGDQPLLEWIELRPTVAGTADSESGGYSDVEGMDLSVSRRGLTLTGQAVTS